MGKNFSRNNSGKRKESDFYETPFSLTREFLKHDKSWNPNLTIVDPCEGGGAITKVLKEAGFAFVVGHDINTDGVDFLTDDTRHSYMITNPPYSIANEFILHAKEVVSIKFAMLLPLTYLQGSFRYNNIWKDTVFPLESIYVFNRYPMLGVPLREDGKFPTGMQTLCWAVWCKGYMGKPEINWLDVDKYVLKKKDT